MTYDVVVVDCHNLVRRAHWPVRDLVNAAGVRVGMEFGFLRSLLTLTREHVPARMVLTWDGDSVRARALDPGYKADRDKTELRAAEPEWDHRLATLRTALADLVETYYDPDFEADEQIAAYVAHHPEHRILIASNDKDFHQLVHDATIHSQAVHVVGSEQTLLDWDRVYKKWDGLSGHHISLFRALEGDKADNLPRIERIRTKVMTAMARSSRDLDSLFYYVRHGMGETSPKEKAKILAGEARIRLNHEILNLIEPGWASDPRCQGVRPEVPALGPVHQLCDRLLLSDIRQSRTWNLFLPLDLRSFSPVQ